MRGRRNTSGKGTDDYWAPKPRITGITPGICNRALGRQSATDFAIPLPLSRLSDPSLYPSFLVPFHTISHPDWLSSSSPSIPETIYSLEQFNSKPRHLQPFFITVPTKFADYDNGREERTRPRCYSTAALAPWYHCRLCFYDIVSPSLPPLYRSLLLPPLPLPRWKYNNTLLKAIVS